MAGKHDLGDGDDQSANQSSRDIVARLRRWSHAVDAVPASDMMDQAADEIERLHTVIDSYCRSAAAACREIDALRGKV